MIKQINILPINLKGEFKMTEKTHEMICLRKIHMLTCLHWDYIEHFLVLNVLEPNGVYDFFDHKKAQNCYMNEYYPNLEIHISLSKK